MHFVTALTALLAALSVVNARPTDVGKTLQGTTDRDFSSIKQALNVHGEPMFVAYDKRHENNDDSVQSVGEKKDEGERDDEAPKRDQQVNKAEEASEEKNQLDDEGDSRKEESAEGDNVPLDNVPVDGVPADYEYEDDD